MESCQSQVWEGRKGLRSPSGVCHTRAVLWSNQAQHFGQGTQLSVLGKVGDLGNGAAIPGASLHFSQWGQKGPSHILIYYLWDSEDLGLALLRQNLVSSSHSLFQAFSS